MPVLNDSGEPTRRQGAKRSEPSRELDQIARQILDSALMVHRYFGPGLLESVYERCLAYEIEKRGIPFKRQVVLPISYDDLVLEAGLRLDMVVADAIVVEVKAIERLMPIHDAQLLTYLKFSGCRIGFLINFNVPMLKEGIRRLIHSP